MAKYDPPWPRRYPGCDAKPSERCGLDQPSYGPNRPCRQSTGTCRRLVVLGRCRDDEAVSAARRKDSGFSATSAARRCEPIRFQTEVRRLCSSCRHATDTLMESQTPRQGRNSRGRQQARRYEVSLPTAPLGRWALGFLGPGGGHHPHLAEPPDCVRTETALTSIVSWVGVDERGPASVYIASDSRISWGNSHIWDNGRKTFASATHPYVFGYCGDVLFPSMVLPIVQEHLASGAIVLSPRSMFGEIGSLIRRLWLQYPHQEHRDFSIVMAARVGDRMTTRFFVVIMAFDADTQEWHLREEQMPEVSSSLVHAGSGANQIVAAETLWQASAHAGTSRAMFSAFCESMRTRVDPHTGGGPQLVGLRRIGTGMTFGVVYEGERHLSGVVVSKESAAAASVEWFNELFERVGGAGMARLKDAQAHLAR